MSGRWAGGGRSGLGKLKQQPRSNAKTLFGRLGNAVLKSAGRLSASPVVTEAMTAHYAFFYCSLDQGKLQQKNNSVGYSVVSKFPNNSRKCFAYGMAENERVSVVH